MTTAKRVMIIGLDCAPPEIVFDDMRAELPVISGLMDRGAWGNLESSDPPITVPAWSCMMSSKDPGTLGFYGFRNRADHSYDGMVFATSDRVKDDRLWDILSRAGKHCTSSSVPMTYPPPNVNGELISCFLTPVDQVAVHLAARAARPRSARWSGEYMFDVRNFRTDDNAIGSWPTSSR